MLLGIIINKSFSQSAVKIVLAMVGAIATIFIYPQNLELYGIFGFVIDTGAFFIPFILVGLGHTSIRFFYNNNADATKRLSFLRSLIKLLLVNAIIFSIVLYVASDRILRLMQNPSQDLSEYFSYVVPSAILFTANQFLVRYLSNYKKVTVPIVLQNTYKIALPLILLSVLYFNVDIITGIWLILGTLAVSTLVLLLMILTNFRRDNSTSFSKGEDVNSSDFFKYYFWAFASSVGTVMAFRLDGFMIPALMDFTSSGEYRIGLFISSIVAIPMQSVLAISAPIISESWKEDDKAELKTVYHKGSRNLLFIGGAVILGLIILVQLLPIFIDTWKDMHLVLALVVIIGLTKLFDMFSSTNTLIIQYSPWYRFNTYVVLFLMVTNVTLNYMLILRYGLIGAALATGISVFLANNLRTYYLYRKMAIHPFTLKGLGFYALILSIAVLALWLNQTQGSLISIVFTIIAALFVLGSFLFVWNLAPEVKETLGNLRAKFKV